MKYPPTAEHLIQGAVYELKFNEKYDEDSSDHIVTDKREFIRLEVENGNVYCRFRCDNPELVLRCKWKDIHSIRFLYQADKR